MYIFRFCTILLLFLSPLVADFSLNWSKHFLGKINTTKLHDIDKDGKNELILAGENGLFVLGNNGELLFKNNKLLGVETVKFIDMDGDGKDEILLANSLSFAILDDDGKTLASWLGLSTFSTHKLAIDAFKDSNNMTQIIVSNQSSSNGSSTGETIYWFNYNPTTKNISYDILKNAQYGYTIPKDGIKVINDKVYIIYNSYEDSFIERFSLTKDFEKKYTISPKEYIFNIHEINGALVLQGSDNIRLISKESGNTITTLNLDSVQNMQWLENKMFVSRFKDSYTDKTSKAMIYTLNNDNSFTKDFEYDAQGKEIKAYKIYKNSANEIELLLSFEGFAKRFDIAANELNSYDLTHGLDFIYFDINSIETGLYGDSFKTILSSIDIVSASENNSTTKIFDNGLLVKNIFTEDIDNDAKNEYVVIDDYHTYLYDDNGSRVWTKYYKANDVAFADLNLDGNLDVVLSNQNGIFAYNKQGNGIYSLLVDDIKKFDIAHMNQDNILDLAYIQYTDNGNDIKVVDLNNTTVFEKKINIPIPNINFLKIIQRKDNTNPSLLVNMGSTFLFELDGSSDEIEYNNFIDSNFITYAFDDYDKDGQDEFVRSFKDEESSKYGIKYVAIEHNTSSEVTKNSFFIGSDEIRGIALLDYDNNGDNEVVVATGKKLALYKKDGTKVWEFDQKLDESSLNHFTHVKTALQSDGNHKIYVSGYKLYEFDKNGNYIDVIKPSNRYMVSSSDAYANPFVLNNDGTITLGQTGVFHIKAELNSLLQTKTLSLNAGWNLVALPVKTTLNSTQLLEKFNHGKWFWKYDGSQWHLLYPAGGFQGNHSFDLISSLNWGEAIWIYNNNAQDIEFFGESYAVEKSSSFVNSEFQWSMLGVGNTTPIQTLFDANNKINIIWKYSSNDKEWKANSPYDIHKQTLENNNIKLLEVLNAGDGFWMQRN